MYREGIVNVIPLRRIPGVSLDVTGRLARVIRLEIRCDRLVGCLAMVPVFFEMAEKSADIADV
jgi:hypothetical protein